MKFRYDNDERDMTSAENHRSELPAVSVVIPTYGREQVLLDTINQLLRLEVAPNEILVIDQTPQHDAATDAALSRLESEKRIRCINLPDPSITHAMNVGLAASQSEVVLFLDDDIIAGQALVAVHARAHLQQGINIVVGQILQPGEEPLVSVTENDPFCFRSTRAQFVSEIMGGNFSIKRTLALRLGGFDENFVHVAYRFESEFADRALAAGERILFVPEASLRHLKELRGGTRAYGHHLTTIKPSHAVGAYYYLLRTRSVPHRVLQIIGRPLRAVRTAHHLTHPWWILPTLVAELLGFMWAVFLALRGPRLVFSLEGSKPNA